MCRWTKLLIFVLFASERASERERERERERCVSVCLVFSCCVCFICWLDAFIYSEAEGLKLGFCRRCFRLFSQVAVFCELSLDGCPLIGL